MLRLLPNRASTLSVTEKHDFLFPGYRRPRWLKLKGHILDMHMSSYSLEFRRSVGSQGEMCFLVVPNIKQHSFSQIRPRGIHLIERLGFELSAIASISQALGTSSASSCGGGCPLHSVNSRPSTTSPGADERLVPPAVLPLVVPVVAVLPFQLA